MTFETVIGLETHVQLATQSKIFSGASTSFGAEPNRQACPVDLALPGVLPVINREAVACAIRFGLAVDAEVAHRSVFARKNYFYPDLPKGYQISQFELPVVVGGTVSFRVGSDRDASFQTVRLTRAHLEEDAGKSLHEDYAGASGIDLNRAGTPLLEIVTEPDMSSAQQAVAYARTLHALVVWLGICDGNMQEGSFRCDANVSVRRPGEPLGTRSEIKNLNSFRFLEQAIEFEVERQIEIIEDGGAVVQETRLYDPDKNETRSMRSKEDAMDYRYFPDPDLPDLVISDTWIDQVKAEMPELPAAKRDRFVAEYGVSESDAVLLSASRDIAAYFESLIAALPEPGKQGKTAANWVMADLSAAVNRDEIDFDAAPVAPGALAALVTRIQDGTITGRVAKDLFAGWWTDGVPAGYSEALGALDASIEAQGLKQINDDDALGSIVQEVLNNNEKSVREFLGGKDKALNALVGQVMKATRGKGNPQRINELMREAVKNMQA